MSIERPQRPDPIAWHAAIALAFLLLAAVRLGIPSHPYFDEVHYLPAARAFLALEDAVNMEHPPLGKLAIAAGIALAGDQPWGWRLPSLLAGALALFAAMRALWLAGAPAPGSVLAGLFIATNFLLLVQARIAMLDMFMAAGVMAALWQCAAASAPARRPRLHLALAGVALGAAMAAKWNAVPLAMLPGLAFLAIRAANTGRGLLRVTTAPPVRGISLPEAALWLGAVPLGVYALCYAPYLLFERLPQAPAGLIELHRQMLELQTQVPEPHPYQSTWWQWLLNLRAIWYLYEVADGAQRGIMLIGNPVTMLAGLPALAWCAIAGWRQRRAECLALPVLFASSLALWIVAPKAVQFYFHYMLPAFFLSAALGLATAEAWRRGHRLAAAACLAASLAAFVWWYPILTAAPLEGEQDFLRWAWLAGWS